MNADGSGQRRLTRNPARDKDPAWSPDGRRIAFNSGSQIWLMNPDGSGQRSLTPAGWQFERKVRTGRPTGARSPSAARASTLPWDLRHERRWQRETKAHATWRGPCLVARRADDRLRSRKRRGALRHERRREREAEVDALRRRHAFGSSSLGLVARAAEAAVAAPRRCAPDNPESCTKPRCWGRGTYSRRLRRP